MLDYDIISFISNVGGDICASSLPQTLAKYKKVKEALYELFYRSNYCFSAVKKKSNCCKSSFCMYLKYFFGMGKKQGDCKNEVFCSKNS